MPISPLSDRIIVRPELPPTTSPGGIIVSVASDKQKTTEGVVIAVGPGRRLDNGERHPVAVKAGQKVVFPLYIGTEVDIEGTTHRVMREDEVLAVYET